MCRQQTGITFVLGVLLKKKKKVETYLSNYFEPLLGFAEWCKCNSTELFLVA